MPVLQQIGQLRGSTDENLRVASVLDTGELIEPVSTCLRCRCSAVQEHHQIAEDVHGIATSAGRPLQRRDLGHDLRLPERRHAG